LGVVATETQGGNPLTGGVTTSGVLFIR
jgi:hypothetical protein